MFAILAMLAPAWLGAAELFSDDAETGTMLPSDNPAGRWSRYLAPVAINSIAVLPAAAHRGSFGIHQIDADSSAGRGGQNHLEVDLPTTASDIYVRFWVRVSQSNGQGSFLIGALVTSPAMPGGASQALTLGAEGTDGQFFSGGFDASAVYLYEEAGTLLPSAWHLLEASITGVGTASGSNTVWLDGAQLFQHTSINRVGQTFAYLSLGEYFSDDKPFAGAFDFDDVRIDTAPGASRLTVTASDQGTGDCGPIVVALVHSGGAGATAPYSFSAELSVTGVTGGFFSEQNCLVPTTTADFTAAGQSSATVYFRPSATGSASFLASHVDFLEGSANALIDDLSSLGGGGGGGWDSSAGLDPWRYRVACGCNQADPATLLTPLILTLRFLGVRRRRRARF